MAGREPLEHGLIKRISDGETTDIWRDRWIANHFNGKPITTRVDGFPNLVSELLNVDGTWNEEFIRAVFLRIDAEAILRQPVGRGAEDCWAWDLERFGIYTVWSAYKILHQRKSEASSRQLASSSGNPMWKKVWQLDVPPKVRVFWWCVMNQFLPTKQILHRWHVEPEAFCEVCGDPEETIKHVLVDCSAARFFWAEIRLATGIKLPTLNTASWADDLMTDLCPAKDRAIILCGMWALWSIRNKKWHGEQSMSMNQAVSWARDTAFDLWQLRHQQAAAHSQPVPMVWCKPEQGWVKINSDAAFSEPLKQGATACVIRDQQGEFSAAKASWHDNGLDALSLEAMACRDGMLFGIQLGFRKVAMETDCLQLVQLWKKKEDQRSIVHHILQEMDELRLAFHEFSFSYVSRSCNKVAHVLAK